MIYFPLCEKVSYGYSFFFRGKIMNRLKIRLFINKWNSFVLFLFFLFLRNPDIYHKFINFLKT